MHSSFGRNEEDTEIREKVCQLLANCPLAANLHFYTLLCDAEAKTLKIPFTLASWPPVKLSNGERLLEGDWRAGEGRRDLLLPVGFLSTCGS